MNANDHVRQLYRVAGPLEITPVNSLGDWVKKTRFILVSGETRPCFPGQLIFSESKQWLDFVCSSSNLSQRKTICLKLKC